MEFVSLVTTMTLKVVVVAMAAMEEKEKTTSNILTPSSATVPKMMPLPVKSWPMNLNVEYIQMPILVTEFVATIEICALPTRLISPIPSSGQPKLPKELFWSSVKIS